MQNMRLFQLTFLTALAPVFWGTTYIVTTELLPPDRPFIAAVIRVLPAGFLLILMSRQLPQRSETLKVLILSFLNIACFQAMLFVAAYHLPGGIAAVVGAVQPLLIMLIMWAADSVKPRAATLIAALFALGGMGLLLIKPDSRWDTTGLLAAFAGAVSMSGGTYLSFRWKLSLSKYAFTGWQLFIGGLMLIPVAYFSESFPAHMVLKNYIGYVYLSFFGSLVAYFLWFQGIKELPTVAVAVLGLLSPVTAVVVGWFWLGQDLSFAQSVGFVTVLVCVAAVQRTARRG